MEIDISRLEENIALEKEKSGIIKYIVALIVLAIIVIAVTLYVK